MKTLTGVVLIGCAVGIVAWQESAHPYTFEWHTWGVTLCVALGALVLAILGARCVLTEGGRGSWTALAAAGGCMIAVAYVVAELTAGLPRRLAAAPGQTYTFPEASAVGLVFPPVRDTAGNLTARTPIRVVIGRSHRDLTVGSRMQVGSFVLTAQSWPAAYVRAWSPDGRAQTVTQPQSEAFVSPVLQFPDLDRDGLPVDSFSVPALHRDVHVKYYPGLPQHGITIPFVQWAISEENGGVLASGVAVSARPVRAAGVRLEFILGTYPVVVVAPRPPAVFLWLGWGAIAAGLAGAVVRGTRPCGAATATP
jgi:hypothetical protein